MTALAGLILLSVLATLVALVYATGPDRTGPRTAFDAAKDVLAHRSVTVVRDGWTIVYDRCGIRTLWLRREPTPTARVVRREGCDFVLEPITDPNHVELLWRSHDDGCIA